MSRRAKTAPTHFGLSSSAARGSLSQGSAIADQGLHSELDAPSKSSGSDRTKLRLQFKGRRLCNHVCTDLPRCALLTHPNLRQSKEIKCCQTELEGCSELLAKPKCRLARPGFEHTSPLPQRAWKREKRKSNQDSVYSNLSLPHVALGSPIRTFGSSRRTRMEHQIHVSEGEPLTTGTGCVLRKATAIASVLESAGGMGPVKHTASRTMLMHTTSVVPHDKQEESSALHTDPGLFQ